MELFYSPFACSLASHITLREADLAADLTAVTLADKKTADGGDFFAVNAKGQVPALRLDDGTVLTENGAIMQYLADRNPAAGLMPPVGAPERYAVLEWLSYVATEIHKSCLWPMFNPGPSEEAKRAARAGLDRRLAYVAAEVGEREFLVGGRFTVADAYLTWVLSLTRVASIPVPASLERYFERMKTRPAVRAAFAHERAAAGSARSASSAPTRS